MSTFRKAAITAGTLFIVATVSSLISYLGILDPILTAPDYLSQVAKNENLVITGVLFELVNNIAIVAIAVVLFPVLRTYSMTLALAYIVARAFESVFITLGDFAILSLVSVGQLYIGADAQSAVAFQAIADTLLTVVNWTFLLGPGVLLSFTALILNYVLYRAKLVPAFLSIWGLLGAGLLYAGDMLAIYGTDQVLLFAAPFALQEMAFAVWLIVKGFNTPAATSRA